MTATILDRSAHVRPLIALTAALPGIAEGAQITLTAASADIADQILAGSLEPHAIPALNPARSADISLLARWPCACFGGDADEGTEVARLLVSGPQSADHKMAIGRALLDGSLAAHLGQVLSAPAPRRGRPPKAAIAPAALPPEPEQSDDDSASGLDPDQDPDGPADLLPTDDDAPPLA